MVDCANLLMISRQEIALNRNRYLVEIPVLSISTYRLKVHQNEKNLSKTKFLIFYIFRQPGIYYINITINTQPDTDEDSF